MQCPHCGTTCQPQAQFCPSCGRVLAPPSHGGPTTASRVQAEPGGARPADEADLRHVALQAMDYRDLQSYVTSLAAERSRILGKLVAMVIVSAIVGLSAFTIAASEPSAAPLPVALFCMVITWGLFGVFSWVFNRGWFIIAELSFFLFLLGAEVLVAMFVGIPYFAYYVFSAYANAKQLEEAEQRLAASRAALGQ